MNIKLRLTVLNFLQFFLWGSWLTSLGFYLGKTLHFSGSQIGSVFTTLGIAAVIMPGLLGIIADKWLNAEKVYGISHIIGGISLFVAAQVTEPSLFIAIMLVNSLFYMPTISLCYSISYSLLAKNSLDIVKEFPPIRVWGTIGFILAMWMVDLSGWSATNIQLILGGVASIILGIYAFTMPSIPVNKEKATSLFKALGLDALVLFKQRKMAVFFFFAILLGAALQITNAFGQDFLDHFGAYDAYKDSFAVKHKGILSSFSQISETLFILTIPFFLRKYGIKKVMLISMIAWVLRFLLFALGDPGNGLFLLILSMIVYGMAFDFFTISGSLFVEKETDSKIRSSAQGLYLMMTNGIGIILGSKFSGYVVDYYSKYNPQTNELITRDWTTIWYSFALYSLIVAVLFVIFFKYKHNPNETLEVKH